MSNKFEDYLIRAILFIIILLPAVTIMAFEPKADDFKNSYQYDMYRSWLAAEKLDGDLPAGFTSTKVVRSFLDATGREINVEYDWHNWKITSQREMIPLLFYTDESQRVKPYIKYIERFIYRLNCKDKKYLFDLVDHDKIVVKYKDNIGEEALEEIWQDRPMPRIQLKPVVLSAGADTLSFEFSSDEMENFIISFPQVVDINEILAEIRMREKSQSRADFSPIIIPDTKMVKPKIEELSLAEYIREYFQTPPRRELLHNKIDNINRFLHSEFAEYSIHNEGNIWHLDIDKHEGELGGNISLRVAENENMIDIFPLNDAEVIGDKIVLNSQELDVSNLTENEVMGIVNYLPQLIYEHRAIGSKLLNFFLVHDEVPSTLVVYSDKRELYETDSYSDILLLLNQYWQDKDIFFGIDNIKKMDGTIEFKGFLAARSKDGVSDIAEIFFHISKEFKIDLIMMILHPADQVKRG